MATGTLSVDAYTLLATCKRIGLSPEETAKLLSDEFEKLFGARLALLSPPTLGISITEVIKIEDKLP